MFGNVVSTLHLVTVALYLSSVDDKAYEGANGVRRTFSPSSHDRNVCRITILIRRHSGDLRVNLNGQVFRIAVGFRYVLFLFLILIILLLRLVTMDVV